MPCNVCPVLLLQYRLLYLPHALWDKNRQGDWDQAQHTLSPEQTTHPEKQVALSELNEPGTHAGTERAHPTQLLEDWVPAMCNDPARARCSSLTWSHTITIPVPTGDAIAPLCHDIPPGRAEGQQLYPF